MTIKFLSPTNLLYNDIRLRTRTGKQCVMLALHHGCTTLDTQAVTSRQVKPGAASVLSGGFV